MNQAGKKVPVVSVKGIRDDPKEVERIALEVDRACKEIGFFYVVDHGISVEVQERMHEAGKEFFALEGSEKAAIAMEKAGRAWRGYFPVGGEYTMGRIDRKEGLYLGTEDGPSKQPMHGSNQWPSRPSSLQPAVSQYIKEVTELAHLLMMTIAVGLHLPADYFSKRFTDSPTVLFRIFNYPVHSFTEEEDEWGVRQHTDMGFLTLLKQDDSGGLEVRNRDGEWIAAPPLHGSFVVNIGDMLEYWTHGLYRATLHRVRNQATHDRLSFPLFFDPNWDASLEPIDPLLLPQVAQEEVEERWDSLDLHKLKGLTYGEFVWSKISKVFPSLAEQVTQEQ